MKTPLFAKNICRELGRRVSSAELETLTTFIANKDTVARWMKAATTAFNYEEPQVPLARSERTIKRMESTLVASY